jgi:hypothetical protein
MVSSGMRNLGEWSEFPAGLEAIRQGLRVAGNTLRYLMGESMDGTILRYSFDGDENLLLDDVIALSSLQYIEMRNILYEGMRRRGRVTAIPAFDDYWGIIGYPKLKAGSGPKADLIFVDEYNNTVGLSVKSLFGKSPTLLNPGANTTRVRYRISGHLPKVQSNNKAMWKQIESIVPYQYCNDVFNKNLKSISERLPWMLAVALGDYFTGGPSKLSELGSEVRVELRKLLLASACGMVPKTPYDHSRPVSKILLVKSDWELELIDLDDEESADRFITLFKFDQPARGKYGDYGRIFDMEGESYIDFVLQIRMI